MARIRTIKPDFFKHENLFDAEAETGLPLRVAFAGLWTQCDREGRFEWRPRMLKAEILPYDDVDFSRVLDALATRGFVVKYASEDREYGAIPSWSRHQVINNRESASILPEPADLIEVSDARPTRAPRDTEIAKGKGKEGEGNTFGDKSPQGPVAPSIKSLEAQVFEFGKDVLGKSAGGVVVNLRKACEYDDAYALDLLKQASEKHDPMAWVNAAIKSVKDRPYRGVVNIGANEGPIIESREDREWRKRETEIYRSADCAPLTEEQRAYAIANGLS